MAYKPTAKTIDEAQEKLLELGKTFNVTESSFIGADNFLLTYGAEIMYALKLAREKLRPQ